MKTTTGSTKTCKNTFLENDGYCTQCGKNHFEQKSRRTAPIYTNPKAPTPKPQTQPTPSYNNYPSPSPAYNSHYTPAPAPVYTPAPKFQPKPDNKIAFKIAQETVAILNELFPEIKVRVRISTRRHGSYYNHLKGEIVFGNCAEWFFQNGYRSKFRTSTRLIASIVGETPTGKQAVQAHAAHEFANAMVAQMDKDPYEVHGSKFYRRFAQVAELVL